MDLEVGVAATEEEAADGVMEDQEEDTEEGVVDTEGVEVAGAVEVEVEVEVFIVFFSSVLKFYNIMKT